MVLVIWVRGTRREQKSYLLLRRRCQSGLVTDAQQNSGARVDGCCTGIRAERPGSHLPGRRHRACPTSSELCSNKIGGSKRLRAPGNVRGIPYPVDDVVWSMLVCLN